MIAFLGTGLLGSGFVRALRARGESVHVWNRSPDKARELEQYGARVFEDSAEAVRGADRIHLTLSDDAAVDATLDHARHGFAPGAAVVDHTTTAPSLTAERAKRWHGRGVNFLHAPVFMGPANALASSGTMLSSGDRARFDAVAPHLERMTGTLVYVGDDPSRAAAMKLLGNQFIVVLTAGLSETLGLAKAMDVPQDEVARLFEFFNPGSQVATRLERLRAADYANPSWKLAMARKDVRLMLDAAARGGTSLPLLPAIAAEMDALIEHGHADDDWTMIARDALE